MKSAVFMIAQGNSVSSTGYKSMFQRFYEYAYHLPAFISFALLALQIALPWAVPHLATMDGSSHVYGATIVRDLLLHGSSSPYFSYYTFQHAIVPNWAGTLALSVAVSIIGVNRAEPLLMSAAILAGFLAWGYVCRALSPGRSPWTPAANFLIQTWFLWTGYHSFYIGMLLLAFPIGYYVRHIGRLTLRHAIGLAGGLLALFFTHLIPAIIALVTLVTTCIWVNLFSTAARNQNEIGQPSSSSRFGELVIVGFAVMPASLLTLLYLHAAATGFAFDPRLDWAWKEFPMHVFTVGGGRSGAQLFLWPCFLFFMVAGISSMTRSEWRSAKGGIAISTLFFFVVYLFAPDRGFNGTEVKVRLSWSVFLLGGIVACSAVRLRTIRISLAIWMGCFMLGSLLSAERYARARSSAAQDYLSVATRMAPQSSFVRLRYPTPRAPSYYGYADIGADPLFHLDAFAAASGRLIDLTDYEALSKIFPVVYKTRYDSMRYVLWGFEGSESETIPALTWVNDQLPAPVDYVLLVGDEDSADAVQAGMPKMRQHLDSTMHLAAESSNRLYRLYYRNGLHQH